MNLGKSGKLRVRNEMEARLSAIDVSEHTRSRLHPHLLAHAGQQEVGAGVVMAFILAVADYTKGLPPMIESLLFLRAKDYFAAMCGDEELLKAANDFWDTTQQIAATELSAEP